MLVNFAEITKIKDINYSQLSLDDLTGPLTMTE